MSTATRWAKGVLVHGMSSTKDMVEGGAGQVFTRVHTKASAKNDKWYTDKPSFIFKPELLTRMDAYCYKTDLYGSQLPNTFSQRVSPAKLVDMMVSSYDPKNEVMFFDAVSLDDVEYLVCDDPNHYITRLEAMGVKKIGGKSLKDAVITRSQFQSINL